MASITQYNAQKCHAYFEGYGNKNGRSWTHVYLKTHLFTPEKLYFTKIKNKKKLRSGAILRSGGDAKQVFFFIWPYRSSEKEFLPQIFLPKIFLCKNCGHRLVTILSLVHTSEISTNISTNARHQHAQKWLVDD